jgi:hypothetical protein
MATSSSRPSFLADTHGRIGPEHVVLYFFATVIGVTILAGWGKATYHHARFTRDTLTAPYDRRDVPLGSHGGNRGSGGGNLGSGGGSFEAPDPGTWAPPADTPTDPGSRGGHLIAPQERGGVVEP